MTLTKVCIGSGACVTRDDGCTLTPPELCVCVCVQEGQNANQPCGPLYPPDAEKHAWLGQVAENADAFRLFPSVSASHTHKHMLCEVPLSGASHLR